MPDPHDTDSEHPHYGEGASDSDSSVDMPLDLEGEDPDLTEVQFTLYDLEDGTTARMLSASNSEEMTDGRGGATI